MKMKTRPVDDQVAVFITPAGKQVLLSLHVDLLTEFPKTTKGVEVCGRKLELCHRRLQFLLFFEGLPGSFSLFTHKKPPPSSSTFGRLGSAVTAEAARLIGAADGRTQTSGAGSGVSCQTTGGNSICRVVTAPRSRPLEERNYKDCVGTWRRSPTPVSCRRLGRDSRQRKHSWEVRGVVQNTPQATNLLGKIAI